METDSALLNFFADHPVWVTSWLLIVLLIVVCGYAWHSEYLDRTRGEQR